MTGIVGRVVASVDQNAAAQLTPDAVEFSGSVNWREKWWQAIWADNRADAGRLLIGHGYGYPINRLTMHVGDDVRTPHSVFFFNLAYGGWIGVLIFGMFNAAVLSALWLVYRREGQLFGLLAWVAALAVGSFSNWYEAPFGAFPTYLIGGMALAPLLRPSTGAPAVEPTEDRHPAETVEVGR